MITSSPRILFRLILSVIMLAGLFGIGVLKRRNASPEPSKDVARPFSVTIPATTAEPSEMQVGQRPNSNVPEGSTPVPLRKYEVSGEPRFDVDTPLPDAVKIARRRIREIDGSYHYSAPTYGVSLGKDAITVGTPRGSAPDLSGSLRYALQEVSVGDVVLASGGECVPRLSEEKREIVYARGSVEERYTIRDGSLEQDFIIRELPEGRGTIRVVGSVQTELDPPQDEASGTRLSFKRQGQEVLYISDAVAIDAAGNRLPLELAYSEGKVSIAVPASWVAKAALPIVIDPLIGSTIVVDGQAFWAGNSLDCAYNSAANEWLVVWNEYLSGGNNGYIMAQRVSASGTLVGAATTVSATGLNYNMPSVAYCSSVNKYLVAWYHGGLVAGRLIPGDGSAPPAQFTVASIGNYPRVASDGTGWFVASTNTTGPGLKGTFVAGSGTLGNTVQLDATYTASPITGVAYAGGVYATCWKKSVSGIYSLFGRTVNASTQALGTTITMASAPFGQIIYAHAVSAKPINSTTGQFLLTWYQGSSPMMVKGQIVNQSLGTVVSSFTINTTTATVSYAASAYCPILDQWLVVYSSPSGNGNLYGNRVAATGSVFSPAEQITTGGTAGMPALLPQMAFNSGNNQMLIAYFQTGNPDYDVLAQRYEMPVPPPPPPPAPTGLIATPGNAQISLSWSTVAGATQYDVKRAPVSGGPYEYVGGSTTGTTFVDTGLINGVPYFYVVSAENIGGEGSSSNEASATPVATAATVLFVVGTTPIPAGSGDSAVASRLTTRGYSVLSKRAAGAGAATTADASGKVLVLISSTVNPTDVNTKFRDVAVPVMLWENGLFDDMKMTGTTSGTHFGTSTSQTAVNIVNNTHVMAAGLPSGTNTVGTSSTHSWADLSSFPTAQVTTVSRIVGSSTRSSLFCYDAGAVMVGMSAPARRVGVFLTDSTATGLNTNGWGLIDAAASWAVNAPLAPINLNTQEGDRTVELTWSHSSGAVLYNVLRSTSLNGPFTLVASGLSSTAFFDSSAALVNGTTYYYRVVAVSASGGLSVLSQAKTAVPTAGGTIVIGVLGPPRLKRMRTGEPFTQSHAGDYFFYVYVRTGNNFVPATGVTGTLTLTHGMGGNHAMVTPTKVNQQQWIMTVDGIEDDDNDESIWTVQYTATVPNFQPKVFNFSFEVMARARLSYQFHFPTGIGQTTQQWPPGSPNQFFVPDDPPFNTRANARRAFVDDLVVKAISVTRQVPLGFYYGVDEGNDNNTTWPPSYFEDDATTLLKYSNGDHTALGRIMLAYGNENRGSVHVYFVNVLKTFSSHAGGICIGNKPDGFKNLIFLPSSQSIDPLVNALPITFAHEIGHALKSDHVETSMYFGGPFGDPNDLRGVIGSNTTDPTTQNYPLNVYLIRPVLRKSIEGSYARWVDYFKAESWQRLAKTQHPSRTSVD